MDNLSTIMEKVVQRGLKFVLHYWSLLGAFGGLLWACLRNSWRIVKECFQEWCGAGGIIIIKISPVLHFARKRIEILWSGKIFGK